MIIKAISLTQPHATLCGIGAKEWETRSWSTSYRGPIAIHAAKGFPMSARGLIDRVVFNEALRPIQKPGKTIVESLPLGCVIAVGRLTACGSMNGIMGTLADWVEELSAQERAFGYYDQNRYGFKLEGVKMLEKPIPVDGMLGLWDFDFPGEVLS